MKFYSILFAGCFLTTSAIQAQSPSVPLKNTIELTNEDTRESIIYKAAHIVPTAVQKAAMEKEFIAFVHFGPNTFTHMEWGTGTEDPRVFALKTLDTDQWCSAMKDAGMKLVIITAKHHDGFVLWQSRYTQHGIMSTDFQNGKGDIVKELAASCKKFGLQMGIYLSPADLYQMEHANGLYGNGSKPTERIIPRATPDRPFQNKTQLKFTVDDYNEYYLNQLFELLTEYGPIHEVWLDGAHPKQKGGQTYNYHAWRKLIKTLAPEAVIFGREEIRWCGNEAGHTRESEWNIIPYSVNPDTLSHFKDMKEEDLGSREKLYQARFLHYHPTETDTSIRDGWFYRDDSLQRTRSAEEVFDIYERSIGSNSILLLNIPPNREGRFSSTDVQVLKETGKRIRKTYGTNLLQHANSPIEVLDNQPNSFIEVADELIITTPKPITFNRLMLQEAISTHSERVEAHAVDIWTNKGWKEIANAKNIGYKRILRFPDVTTTRIRLRIKASRLTPAISHISAHYYQDQ